MAQVPSPIDAPVTEEAFLADRMAFWAFFTGLTVKTVIFLVVLLVLMAIFLV